MFETKHKVLKCLWSGFFVLFFLQLVWIQPWTFRSCRKCSGVGLLCEVVTKPTRNLRSYINTNPPGGKFMDYQVKGWKEDAKRKAEQNRLWIFQTRSVAVNVSIFSHREAAANSNISSFYKTFHFIFDWKLSRGFMLFSCPRVICWLITGAARVEGADTLIGVKAHKEVWLMKRLHEECKVNPQFNVSFITVHKSIFTERNDNVK